MESELFLASYISHALIFIWKIVSIQLNLKEITCENEELKTNLAKKDAERLEAIDLAKETEIDQREKVFTLQNINHQLTDQVCYYNYSSELHSLWL